MDRTAFEVTPSRSRRISSALVDWYGTNARVLPWRDSRDPYAIWLSEIMLQQTQVETVKPYYQRFLRRLPSVEKLARARLDTVLKLWEGLGYYTRARNLHQAARLIVRDFAGRIPEDKKTLLTLPGVGPYTAGAISSIAFGRPEPIVDGNVIRVLCRVFCIEGLPSSSPVKKRLWSLAAQLVPADAPGTFNQAMMELGAMVCLPDTPACRECPLSRLCGARRHREQTTLPTRTAKKPIPHYTVVVGIIYKQGRILIDKRQPDGLLGGLWEFPGGKKKSGESLKAALKREVAEELKIDISVGSLLTKVDHAYSHFRITLHAFECHYLSGTPRCHVCQAFKWVLPEQLKHYAFPAANKKVIDALGV